MGGTGRKRVKVVQEKERKEQVAQGGLRRGDQVVSDVRRRRWQDEVQTGGVVLEGDRARTSG